MKLLQEIVQAVFLETEKPCNLPLIYLTVTSYLQHTPTEKHFMGKVLNQKQHNIQQNVNSGYNKQ